MRTVIRNIGLFRHSGAGKTSLADALLHHLGGSDRKGRVQDGTSYFDADPETQRRKVSVQLSCFRVDTHEAEVWNLIDTPGYMDFRGETVAGAALADIAVVVVDGQSGVQIGTEWALEQLSGKPVLIVINKLDRDHASLSRVYQEVASLAGPPCVLWATADVDGPQMRHVQTVLDDLGPVHDAFVETAVEQDDALLSRYLEGNEIPAADVRRAFFAAVARGALRPVCAASAERSIGIDALEDVLRWIPLEAPGGKAFVGRVVKTMADPYVGKLSIVRVLSGQITADQAVLHGPSQKMERVGHILGLRGRSQVSLPQAAAGDVVAFAKLADVQTGDLLHDPAADVPTLRPLKFPPGEYRLAVHARTQADEDKMGPALARLMEEDPSLHLERNDATHEWVLWGLGDMHLEVLNERLKRKFHVDVDLTVPQVAYRETIQGQVKAEAKHKKQSGGRGQYGHVVIELKPTADGGEFQFVDKIYGGVVPQQYRPAVEKGVREAMAEGIVAGYPMVGVCVTLLDGSYHPVDSSELAFKIAAGIAFKKGAHEASPVLLEPVLRVRVMCPEVMMGDVISELTRVRGKVLGMDGRSGVATVQALVPEAETFRLPIELRAITQGRAEIGYAFDRYEQVPALLMRQVAAARTT